MIQWPLMQPAMYAVAEGMPGHSICNPETKGATRLGEQLKPKTSGAIGLTSALLSTKSSGSFIGHEGLREPRSSNVLHETAHSGDFSLRAAHPSSMLDGAHDGARASRSQGGNSAGRRFEEGEGAALLAGRLGKVGVVKPRPHAEAGVPGTTSAAGAWWMQCWAVRLCLDCARCT